MCYTVDEIKEIVIPIAMNYGIQSMSLFGSYARNEANDNSDIDICIEKGALRSLLQYFSFVNDLEKSLNCHVDVVTTDIEDKEFLIQISKEMVVLYER